MIVTLPCSSQYWTSWCFGLPNNVIQFIFKRRELWKQQRDFRAHFFFTIGVSWLNLTFIFPLKSGHNQRWQMIPQESLSALIMDEVFINVDCKKKILRRHCVIESKETTKTILLINWISFQRAHLDKSSFIKFKIKFHVKRWGMCGWFKDVLENWIRKFPFD